MPKHTPAQRRYCEQAIALDPEYAAPHALLGFITFFSSTHTGRPMPEVAPLVRREPRRALELDPFDTDPHYLLGSSGRRKRLQLVGSGQGIRIGHGESVRASRSSMGLRSLCCQPFGRFEESTTEMRRAVEKDPLSVIWRGVLMAQMILGGKFDEALQEGLKALDIADNEIHPHLALSEAYLALGRID
jgi:tetratricopeptide (TPR) repeat protein